MLILNTFFAFDFGRKIKNRPENQT